MTPDPMANHARAALLDLRERLDGARDAIEGLKGYGSEHWRLRGKAEGIGLAITYVDEALRDLPAVVVPAAGAPYTDKETP